METVALTVLVTATFEVRRRPSRLRIYISSLDERAYLRYGVLFDALPAQQQAAVLAKYRVRTYVWTPLLSPDAEEPRVAVWTRRIRISAICLSAVAAALLCWAVGEGHARESAEVLVLLLLAGGLTVWISADLAKRWIEPDAPSVMTLRKPDWI